MLKMKNVLFFAVLASLLFSCSKEPIISEFSSNEAIDVDAVIDEHLHRNNDIFNWDVVNIDVLWTAIEQGDHIVTVGYGTNGQYALANTTELKAQKEELLNDILTMERRATRNDLKLNDIFLNANEVLAYFDIIIKDKATLEYLKEEKNLRYVEPGNYIYKKEEKGQNNSYKLLSDGLGCGTSGETINPQDYTVVAPAAWVPWNFYSHNIPQAWNESTGANIEVGIVDTGISPVQDNFSTEFNTGLSNGRTAGKDGTYVSSWWPWADPDGPDDLCGHGTSMAAAIAAPRTGENVPVGVAYNSNLFTVRGAVDVTVDGYGSQNGVTDAIVLLANRNSTKVISMSLGNLTYVGKIADAIRYAVNYRGKLFFSAGGTSSSLTSWIGVTFPATMAETVAVTGVTNASDYEACGKCHSGSAIDFTIIMEREEDSDRRSVMLGFEDNWVNYIGGSSVATATTAGIAALVWSKHPNWTSTDVLNALKAASDFYPSRHSDFGYGNIDALQAVQQ